MADADLNVVINLVDNMTAKLTGAQKNLEGFHTTAKKVGTAFTAIGVAGAGFLGVGVNVAKNFEKQMSSIKALTGATDDQLKAAHDLALQLGSETAFTALEAAQGMEELLKAGVSMSDVMGGAAKGALDLAAAGGISVADAATVASTALNAFEKDQISVTRAADILAGAANSSAAGISDLQLGLSQASAVAAGVGLSFEDTSATLAAFSNNGLRGSDAGTSLKTMLMNLQPITDRQVSLFQDLGIVTEDGANKFYDAQGKIKGMADIAGVLQESMSGMTDQQRIMALEVMFGSDAIRAGNILFKEGADGINNMKTELNKFTAADVAAERMNNLWGAVDRFKAAIETELTKAFEKYLPTLTKIIDATGEFITKNSELVPYVIIGVAAFTSLMLVMGPLLLSLALLPSILGGIAAVMTGLTVIAGALATAIGAITLPIVIVVAAIAGLIVAGVLLYKHWDTIKAKAIEIWNSIVDKFNEVKTKVGEILTGISQSFSAAWDYIKMVVKTTLENTKTTIQNIWENIKIIIQNAIIAIQTAIQTGLGIAKTIIDGVMTAIKFLFALYIGSVITLFEKFGIDIVAVVTTVLTTIKNTFNNILEALKNTFNAIVTAWEIAIAAVSIIITAFVLYVTNKLNEISTNLKNKFNEIAAYLRDKINSISSFLTEKWEAIKNMFGEKMGEISEKFRNTWDNMKVYLAVKMNEFTNVLKNFAKPIADVFSGIWESIKNNASAAMSGLVGIIKNVINGIIGTINGFIGSVNGVAAKAGSIPGVGDIPQIPNVPYLARGTDNFQGGIAMVGEEGPELVIMPQGSKVIPNNKLSSVENNQNKKIEVNIYEASNHAEWLSQLDVTLRTAA